MLYSTKKPRDMAQKWRAFKNFARLTKNPFGYIYWKIQPMANQNRLRPLWVMLSWHLYFSFGQFLASRSAKEGMMEKWRYVIGESNRHHGAIRNDQRMPADHKKNYVRYSNLHQQLKNKRLNSIWYNWWSRDQAFRKYFEMRKKNGISPSLSGFYHEKLYEETAKKNAGIAAMRHSRQAA